MLEPKSKLLRKSIEIVLPLLAVLSSSVSQAQPKKVVLIIHTSRDDVRGSGGNPELDYLYARKRLENQFPDAAYLRVEGTDNRSIRERLSEIMQDPEVEVQAMDVDSHGTSRQVQTEVIRFDDRGVPYWSLESTIEPYIGNESGAFRATLSSHSGLADAFAPIIGRFADGAKLLFSGCKTMNTDNAQLAMDSMLHVSRAFRLKNGAIYLNRTDGIKALAASAGQPFYEQPNFSKGVNRVLSQALSLVTVPLAGFLEEYVANHGYSLYVAQPERYELYEDQYFDAAANFYPMGKKLLDVQYWKRSKGPARALTR
jgi:hypothetical protein